MAKEADVIVVGSGFTGIYAVHKLRDELGLTVQGFDAAGGVGGTWWWNRYPGARCDIESVHYSYSFSEEIQKEWQWSERYSAQPEILRYLEFVADKLDVRKAFQFSTRVTSMVWNEDTHRWTVSTDTGDTCTAQFVVAGTGNVTVPKSRAEFPGIERFKGTVYGTSTWPHEGVDFTGKRVGIIGTGSTAVQLIPEIAQQAEHLTVFQRTANYAVPNWNSKLAPEKRKWNTDNAPKLRAGARDSFMGVPYKNPEPSALAVSDEVRKARFDELWKKGGFEILISSYADVLTSEDANESMAAYVREQIRARVKDPKVAELLCPKDHPVGTKRLVMEDGYYETYNRDNVTLVDIKSTPIDEITETGVRVGDEIHEFDAIVLAVGFDALTGALLNMGIVGRDGVKLGDRWANGPRTYLGISSAGFPNLFYVTGPTSGVALYNNPLAIEDHVDFVTDAIRTLREKGVDTIEPDPEAESVWYRQVDGILQSTLFPKAKSWYMGANVPGKPRAAFIFVGAAVLYRAMCKQVVDRDYAGFRLGGRETSTVPPLIRVDPSVAQVVGAMLMEGIGRLDDLSLEQMRETVEGLKDMQLPAPQDVRRIEKTYPGAAGKLPVHLHVPDGVHGPMPVVVYFHGGGFVSGSIEMCSKVCARLAKDLQAIVVAPSYRLAPEAPFPAATDDTYAAVRWASENIAEIGGDPERLLVMGESAGAMLATIAAQRARDDVEGPAIAAQVLLYPAMDIEAQTDSRVEFADGPILGTQGAHTMMSTYLVDLANAKSPLASPNRAESLRGLPPALVISAECDPLRDEGEAYGRAMKAAGVDAEVLRLKGMVHGVYNMSAYVPRVAEFNHAIGAFLERILAGEAEPA